uniref:Uncharacterized protein n=1 Tax=Fagus sylvatica TaxID=28930 RepID=A0A2N9EJV0_FAGSY
MGELDPAFIQPIDHRPNLNPIEVSDDEVPVLDLFNIILNSQNHTQKDIDNAGQSWGFFQAAKKFFDQSLEVKRDEVNVTGYYYSEDTKDVRDWKEVYIYFTHDPKLVSALHERIKRCSCISYTIPNWYQPCMNQRIWEIGNK